MASRRDFLKSALLVGAGTTLVGALPVSIQKAFAINPPKGSTYLDAEHVVILMQENRSFDHAYGTLRGVRGFNDPRVLILPNGNPVWFQSNAVGETYAPFRLNMKDTNATWMGSLPHGRRDQVDARNHGKHNGWLEAKKHGEKKYAHIPLTMGYYTREDIPFYYALADAFTICDQNFCSSLTPTTPNRLHLWTGTVRAEPSVKSKAHVNNEDTDYDAEVSWKTFPERLEESGISWRVYQNEISLASGLEGEADAWLTNFGDNPLEWFTQYQVRFSKTHQAYLVKRERQIKDQLRTLKGSQRPLRKGTETKIPSLESELEKIQRDRRTWTRRNFAKLSTSDRDLHEKAFTVNNGDPNYRRLATLEYGKNRETRQMQAPKGDVFHRFRKDVNAGNLPTVSWLVPPERFSDHPSSPWYGAWYLSEAFDILTCNPDVWKKTIFILCYDENDGYFDHIPPFVAPDANRSGTGKVSDGIDPSLEYVAREQDGYGGPIGLGYRVPLLIASPWSRGGYVCSQVFDHTSILRLLENFLSHKTGLKIRETNITEWRRTVCGDLMSVFRPYEGQSIKLPEPLERTGFLGSIHEAQSKPLPATFRKLTPDEIAQGCKSPASSTLVPQQEKGVRPSCALPYELLADGMLTQNRKSFMMQLGAGNELFGKKAAGAPFHVYTPVRMHNENEPGRTWDYAVRAGDHLSDFWNLSDFENGIYHLRVHGPNGFFREFVGTQNDLLLEVSLRPVPAEKRMTGDAELRLVNRETEREINVLVDESAYDRGQRKLKLRPSGNSGSTAALTLELAKSHYWYDIRLSVLEAPNFRQHYAGRIETGREGLSDPLIGRGSIL